MAEDTLKALASARGKQAEIHLYGQEVNAETYAISKADLLLKGEGEEAENFVHGSTLSAEGFPTGRYDFMLSNPPYGKSWKTDLDRLGGKSGVQDARFVIRHAGEGEYSLLPVAARCREHVRVGAAATRRHRLPERLEDTAVDRLARSARALSVTA